MPCDCIGNLESENFLLRIVMIENKRGRKIGFKVSEKELERMRQYVPTEETKQKIKEAMLGKKLSEEHKQNLSIAMKKRKHTWGDKISAGKKAKNFHHSEETKKKLSLMFKGRSSYMKGKKMSPESREKMRAAHHGKILSEQHKYKISLSNRGEKGSRWKGGVYDKNMSIRRSMPYKKWAIDVKERDNYTCQHCEKRGGKLNSHHIKTFAAHPDLILDLANGITLCTSCHLKEHKRIGKIVKSAEATTIPYFEKVKVFYYTGT